MKTIILIAVTCFLVSCSKENTKLEPVSVVPKPVSLSSGEGYIQWTDDVSIIASTDDEIHVAEILQRLLAEKNITPKIRNAESEPRIRLRIIESDSLNEEGYKLSVDEEGAEITATTGAGLFYGVQTLLQLIQKENYTPYVKILDYPRFGYRGLHLDVGRHMFTVSFIKRYIDLMSRFKLNRFHWHLTEDQGWRIEIKKYPKLQEVAAFRKETVIGRASTRTRNQVKGYDGVRYGGYYTQEEIKDVVQYADDHFITVIPEIELPGHAMAALAAYPNLGCTGGPYETATTWGIFDDVYCAGKEETFIFLQDVLDEVIALFPGQYIHIGGDEVFKTRWKECPHCKKRMKKEKLKDTGELQSYFIGRIEKYLNSKDKQIIGWDEILEGGLAPNATVMSWRGESGGIAASKQGHDVIMSPEDWYYLDHAQDTVGNEPVIERGFTPLKQVYDYEPIPESLTNEEARHILGAQCNVWTEYMKSPDQVEYMAYPRVLALAETVWTPKAEKDYKEFIQRMKQQVKRLAEWDVNYARHIEKEFDLTDSLTRKGAVIGSR
jgi:hexosaminidase